MTPGRLHYTLNPQSVYISRLLIYPLLGSSSEIATLTQQLGQSSVFLFMSK